MYQKCCYPEPEAGDSAGTGAGAGSKLDWLQNTRSLRTLAIILDPNFEKSVESLNGKFLSYLQSYTFASNLSVLPMWIRIRNTDSDPQHWNTYCGSELTQVGSNS